uniref:non-specific serine/threonine protein kinase n=1 Tax=Oncorhynchus tshawytscha TaxID=74940 RepID=A0A8C8CJZ5_ONCTS
MPPKAQAAGKGRGPAKRKLAEEFPLGEVLTDTSKKSWKLGAPIGQGGFGLLYLANDNSSKTVGADAPYVIKVEPSDNGPLFSELKFYMRAAKPDLIQSWMTSHKMKYLGVPKYWGSGLHEKGGKRYRFMVMDRFGTDLQKKFEETGRRFPRKLVLQLGLRLLDILEYIHEHEYVHADIKASNLLLSHNNPNQVYLVDYGLAYRYAPEGVLKEYKEDPKRCHDGTIEFTSIDFSSVVSSNGAGPSSSAKKTSKRKKVVDYKEESDDEVDGSPAKKRKSPKKKGVKESKTASPKKKAATPKNTAARSKKALVEMGTQTTPGLKRGRGRPKKKAEPVDSE